MRYDEDQDDVWQKQIKDNYGQQYIHAIKEYVISVLSRVDPKNPNLPVSLTFEWVDPTGPRKEVTMTHAGDAYTITIYGLPEPPG